MLRISFFSILKEKWDGKWRIISYEIPEKNEKFATVCDVKCRVGDLGPWHRSFWLTPHPISIYFKISNFPKEEEKYIQAFEADHTFGDREILIEKVWGKISLR